MLHSDFTITILINLIGNRLFQLYYTSQLNTHTHTGDRTQGYMNTTNVLHPQLNYSHRAYYYEHSLGLTKVSRYGI